MTSLHHRYGLQTIWLDFNKLPCHQKYMKFKSFKYHTHEHISIYRYNCFVLLTQLLKIAIQADMLIVRSP